MLLGMVKIYVVENIYIDKNSHGVERQREPPGFFALIDPLSDLRI
jgi:hypothetical protein